MKRILSDFLIIVGLLAIAAGAALICIPAGCIVGGFAALLLGWCVYRSDNGDAGKDGDAS